MKRPEIRLDNCEAVYDYYQYHRPFKPVARLGYYAMAKLMDPIVTYDDGAKEEIAEHLGDDGQLALISNHLLDVDQYTIASLASCEPTLRPLRGKTFILSKPPVFTDNKIQRIGVDTMGGIPVWRSADSGDDTEETKALRARATNRMLRVCDHRIVDLRNHFAIFGEGTRNKVDPEVVQPFKHGAANMIQAAGSAVNMLALPIGIRYLETDKKLKRRPQVHIGRLLRQPPRTAEQSAFYTHRMRAAVQACVDETR